MECVYEKGDVRIFKISDRVYFRKLPYYKSGQCNGVYIVTDDGIGVVDCSKPGHYPEFLEETETLFHQDIRFVLLTHNHHDHIEGLPEFIAEPKTVFCSEFLYQGLEPAMQQSGSTFVTVRDRMRLNLAGVELELFRPVGTMHKEEEMFIRIVDDHAVCTGDCLIDFRVFYCMDGNLKNWVYNLERIFSDRDEIFLPGHGMPMGKDAPHIMAENIRRMMRAGETIRSYFTTEEFMNLNVTGIREAIRRYMSEDSEDLRGILEASGEYAAEQLEYVMRYMVYRVV